MPVNDSDTKLICRAIAYSWAHMVTAERGNQGSRDRHRLMLGCSSLRPPPDAGVGTLCDGQLPLPSLRLSELP